MIDKKLLKLINDIDNLTHKRHGTYTNITLFGDCTGSIEWTEDSIDDISFNGLDDLESELNKLLEELRLEGLE